MTHFQSREEITSFAVALGDAHFLACQRVHDFIGGTVRPILERQPTADADDALATYLGALLRVHAWLRSVGHLKSPADFQAHATAARTTLENATDLTLLLHNGTEDSIGKLLAWEESAKLKSSERFMRFYKSEPNPPHWIDVHDRYIKTEGARIQALRDQFWFSRKKKKGLHPARWTGRDLATDTMKADTFENHRLGEVYSERYDRMCWFVHGSALTGLRGTNETTVAMLAANALEDTARLAIVVCRLALQLCKAADASTDIRFEALEREIAEGSQARLDAAMAERLAKRSQPA